MEPFKNYRMVNKTEIARRLGISPRYVAYLLKGERGKGSGAKTLAKIKELIREMSREAA